MRLRGTSSFISGSDPLYNRRRRDHRQQLVDASRPRLARQCTEPARRLNPADIERIEVIRGAAAAALYGSRANNGVVQIFTKRGSVGRSRISLHTRVAQSELPTKLRINDYPFDINGNPVTRVDVQDLIFRDALTLENNLSVDGGNEQTRYYINGTWSEEDGIQRGEASSRRGGRVNITQQVRPRLTLDLGANFVNTHNEFLVNGEGTAS